MSVEVIKSGVSDAIQDFGRFGFQHLGINPGGAMDASAMCVANALVGNSFNEAIIEMRFPASTLYFHEAAIIAISGSDFSARLNGKNIPINQPIFINKESELKFTRLVSGNFLYLAIHGGFACENWLGSKSTNTKALIGGSHGRTFKKHDKISLNKKLLENESRVYPWRAKTDELYSSNSIRCLKGNEFDWLTSKSQHDLSSIKFKINSTSDRMGYQLLGKSLKRIVNSELLSTAVDYGTIQLLPTGELTILMADHQTTGGYPRVAHVIRGDRSSLVQKKLDDYFPFQFITIEEAESIAVNQHRVLNQLAFSCKFKFEQHIKPYIS